MWDTLYIIGISLKHLCTFISFKMKNFVLCAIYLYLWYPQLKMINLQRENYGYIMHFWLSFKDTGVNRTFLFYLMESHNVYIPLFIWFFCIQILILFWGLKEVSLLLNKLWEREHFWSKTWTPREDCWEDKTEVEVRIVGR